MLRSFTPRARSRGNRLDTWARAAARRRSLQDLDAWARRVGRVLPPLGDYREMRAIAVTGSDAGLQSFAARVARGHATAAQLWEALDLHADGRSDAAANTLRHVHPRRAQQLAWLLLQRHTRERDLERAIALITWVAEHHGQRALTTTTRGVLLESLVLMGRPHDAAQVLAQGPIPDELRPRAEADLAHPRLGGDHQAWETLLNAALTQGQYAPVSIGDAKTAYLGLQAEASPVPADARVTVVVSSYRPDEMLVHAVRSVLRSSWQNLEVLVVDDASGDDYADVYTRVAALDPRVRVHTMPTNGGTYAIRNWALEHAHGELITFHDSDDWMHPERIAIQMDYLRTHPDAVACVSRSLRVTHHLQLINRRSLGTKLCEPSLLFNRVQVTDRIGGFDGVRKGGDAEFRQRLETAYGAPVPIVASAPLTLQLISDDSLSGGDISRYTVSMPRRIYRASYERWHAQRRAEGLPARLDSSSGAPREFYAPDEIRGGEGQQDVDVTFTADLLDSRRTAPAREALAAARRATAAGSVVGFRHVDGPWHRGLMSVNVPRALIAMLNTGQAVMMTSAGEE